MARDLGYGGIANTRQKTFAGKASEVVAAGGSVAIRRDVQIPSKRYRYGYRYILAAVLR